MSATTPGPWRAERFDEHPQPWAIKGSDGYYLASIHSDAPEAIQEANALLGAAAPELAEALQGFVCHPDEAFTRNGVRGYFVIAEHVEVARAALTKAGVK